MSEQAAVYRLFDADGTLLYVGVANDPPMRLESHSRIKKWWAQVKRHELEWHSDRAAALRAEAAAIHDENPLYNIALPPRDGSAKGTVVRTGVPEIARNHTPRTPVRLVRFPVGVWERFEDAVAEVSPVLTPALVLQWFAHWYLGDTDVPPPRPSASWRAHTHDAPVSPGS